MAVDEPAVYERDGIVYYRASALGGCLTALAAARQKLDVKPVPEKFKGIFQAGHDAEDRFNAAFPNLIKNRQMEVHLPITKRIVVIGHIDGTYNEHDVKGFIAELKSQSDDEFDSWTPDHWLKHPLWMKYAWQVSIYPLAMEHSDKGGREWAVKLFRMRRDNPENFLIYEVPRFYTLEDIMGRVLDAEALAHEDNLSCTTPSYPCPYYYLHPDDFQLVDDKELTEAADDYIKAAEDVKFGESIKALAKEKFKEVMGRVENSDKVITPHGVKITRSEYERKERVIPAGREIRYTVTPPK